MGFATFTRILTHAAQNFWRNIWLSVVTITIITLSLLSISFLGVLRVVSTEALTRLQERIDISVYLKPELKDEEVENVRTTVRTLGGVAEVEMISASEALARFKERHQGNPKINESLALLEDNPLGASLIVRAQTEEAYTGILQELQSEQFTPYISDANFDDYRKVIEAVSAFTGKLTSIGQAVSLFFLVITLLVVFNTIRINIYTHREEIAIMRLVGATGLFIRAPFWVESLLYAAIATLITAGIFFPLLSVIQPYVAGLFNGSSFDIVAYFSQNSVWFFGAQFLGMVLLSALASMVAMRRYLRV